tara:strand:+ start:3923 stop:4600 length:678 start_codon:yes stop_codon:yes gene_type:complete
MHVVGIVAWWWVMLGLGFLPTLIVLETLAAVIKGPEYTLWVRRNHEEMNLKVGAIRMAVVWLFIWPFIFVQWLRAGWAKMTLTEYNIRNEIARQERKRLLQRRSLEATAVLTDALGTGQGTVWFAPYVQGMEVQPYVRAVARQSALVCTHLVGVMPDGTVAAVRLGVVMEGNPPDPDFGDEDEHDFASDNLTTVVEWCNNDTRWNELCESGSAAHRRLYQQGVIW